MGQLGTTWEMMKASGTLLWQDKRLLVFPFLAIVLSSALGAIIATSETLQRALDAAAGVGNEDGNSLNVFALILVLLIYIGSAFIVTFFNGALTACAFKRLQGKRTSVAEGLDKAVSRVDKIAGWAILAGVVGFALELLERQSKSTRDWLSSLLGFAWSTAAYLAIPVVMARGVGPFAALKESVQLLQETLGEQFIARIGIGVMTVLLSLLGVAVIIGIVFATGGVSSTPPFMTRSVVITAGIATAIYVLMVVVVMRALSTVYRAAVYIQADTGESPEGFDLRQIIGESLDYHYNI